jgi:hypothetical protein
MRGVLDLELIFELIINSFDDKVFNQKAPHNRLHLAYVELRLG